MVLALCTCCLSLLFSVCGNISELFLGDSNEEKSITPLRTLCPLKLCPQFLHTPPFRPCIQIQLPLSVGWTFSALETGHEKRVLCLMTHAQWKDSWPAVSPWRWLTEPLASTGRTRVGSDPSAGSLPSGACSPGWARSKSCNLRVLDFWFSWMLCDLLF